MKDREEKEKKQRRGEEMGKGTRERVKTRTGRCEPESGEEERHRACLAEVGVQNDRVVVLGHDD